METHLIYYHSPETALNETQILDYGTDDNGFFIIPQESCYFPGGGGQESDTAEITIGNTTSPIIKGTFNANSLKIYIDRQEIEDNAIITLRIDPIKRAVNSQLHTAGHLITSIIYEELKLNLTPINGSHYPSNSAIEFDTANTVQNITIEAINSILDTLILQKLPIHSKVVSTSSSDYKDSFRISHFTPKADTSIRLVKIGKYLNYACGGTHVADTAELQGIRVLKVNTKKNILKVKYGF
ncbi:alanyl-tRNA editing protein [Sphingobacterium paucimobilis]|uniref:Threonyl/alanyl tRNA synthetase SAD domain-containing protein n=1 Tax=Sphingobacterium paucimobilis HER1398 TaxID=1346330 RepID=U2HUE4_9SPHI|nr:hypothetical protein [Sphingobacterium paucimobilis]ERJ59127.1 hypothetical protein M472_10115 [Sphingobacterium paucimobilis HER1398]